MENGEIRLSETHAFSSSPKAGECESSAEPNISVFHTHSQSSSSLRLTMPFVLHSYLELRQRRRSSVFTPRRKMRRERISQPCRPLLKPAFLAVPQKLKQRLQSNEKLRRRGGSLGRHCLHSLRRDSLFCTVCIGW